MAIEYKTLTYRTVESANDNATYCWVELSASHVPAVNGVIKRIVIQGATDGASGFTTDPMYLGLWERQDDGGLISLGCSKNAIVQALNQENIWEFDGAIITGKSLLLGLLSSPDEHWTNNTQLLLRSRVQNTDTDGCVILTNVGRIRCTPDITFTVEYPEFVPDDEPEPEPEPEAYTREVDISKYWIPQIRETAEFQQIANATNPEFNRLIACQNRLLKDGFILEATEYGVSRWEAILHLAVKEGMTLDERKAQIIYRLGVQLPYTWRVFREMMDVCVGEDNFTMSLDNDTQTLHMGFTSSVWDTKMNDIESLLKRVLPMNLDVKYDPLPLDFVELEYIETSGKQYLRPDVDVSSNLGCALNFSVKRPNMYVMEVRRVETRFTPAVCLSSSVIYGFGSYQTSFSHALQPTDLFVSRLNLGNSKKIEITINGVLKAERTFSSAAFSIAYDALLLAQHRDGAIVTTGAARLYSAIFTEGVETVRDMVPVLDANDTPCMFDKISRKCFYNQGTGTFGYRLKVSEGEAMQLDLDDPYYTAPSGVWAKLIAENELDIIADTDMKDGTAQGYKWFANTGDANKYFNIVEEVIENE